MTAVGCASVAGGVLFGLSVRCTQRKERDRRKCNGFTTCGTDPAARISVEGANLRGVGYTQCHGRNGFVMEGLLL